MKFTWEKTSKSVYFYIHIYYILFHIYMICFSLLLDNDNKKKGKGQSDFFSAIFMKLMKLWMYNNFLYKGT